MGILGGRRSLRALVAGTLVFGGVAVTSLIGESLPASAAPTAVSLYVVSGGAGTADCTSPANACSSIGTAITTATGGTYNGDDVTINVAASPTAYNETDIIDASSLNSLTIAGAGASTTTASGPGIYGEASVFLVQGGTVTISGLTITNGSGLGGGGIEIDNGTVTLDSSSVTGNGGNVTDVGGGISNAGTLTINSSTVAYNDTSDSYNGYAGGGIFNQGTLTINASTVFQNSGGSFETNRAGGILNQGTATINSSTVYGNLIGIGNIGTMTIGATIVAGNDDENCSFGVTTDLGYNLTDDAGYYCGLAASTDVLNANPHLDPIGYYGGPTETLLPAANSPAIGVIPSSPPTTFCPRTDQRGMASVGNCAIGAVEASLVTNGLHVTTPSLPEGTVGQPYSGTLQAAGGNPPYRFWYVAGGSLPKGLGFNSITGVLSGRPSKAGTYTVTFRVRDAKIRGSAPPKRAHTKFTIVIVPA